MSEWITDRRPNKADAYKGMVWVWRCGMRDLVDWDWVIEGEPWQPISKPKSYVKPKRWVAEYRHGAGCWIITDKRTNLSAMGTILRDNTDEHRQAAEEIADIYERTMP